MSPLVRSLLALAALFATAATLPPLPPPPPNCTEEIFGRRTGNEKQYAVHVDPPGGVIRVENKCGLGANLVGIVVDACNYYPFGEAPKVDGDLNYVEVWCVDDCPAGLTVFIMEYCEPLVPPFV